MGQRMFVVLNINLRFSSFNFILITKIICLCVYTLCTLIPIIIKLHTFSLYTLLLKAFHPP